MAQARSRTTPPKRRVIAAHVILSLCKHWAVNDPRGSESSYFYDLKSVPLGPIHFVRKSHDEQPTRDELRAFHAASFFFCTAESRRARRKTLTVGIGACDRSRAPFHRHFTAFDRY